EQGQPSEQSAEGVPLSDTCQSIHTPSGGANELQLSRASPVNSPLKVCLCRTPVNHLTPPLEVLTSSSSAGRAQLQSAEGVPLSHTCQSIHTPSGGANELQLSRASSLNSPLKVCLCRTPVNQFTPPLEVPTSSSSAGQAQCQSAEGVPLSDTCQSHHTTSGGANELQLSGASPVPVR